MGRCSLHLNPSALLTYSEAVIQIIMALSALPALAPVVAHLGLALHFLALRCSQLPGPDSEMRHGGACNEITVSGSGLHNLPMSWVLVLLWLWAGLLVFGFLCSEYTSYPSSTLFF